MLKRGQSDFEWFKNRADTFNSDLVNEYSTSSAMASLNPEPAAPDERAEQGLPPKSYAKATIEPFEKQQQENGDAVKPNGIAKKSPEDSKANGFVNGTEEKLNEQKVVFEKYSNGDGEVLTSVKPTPEYELGLKHDAETAPRDHHTDATQEDTAKSEDSQPLSSGRQAGAGWERSAIRWAPLNIPLQRRLQTLIVLIHTLSVALGISLFLLLCSIPLFWPLLIPYFIYTLIFSNEASDGRLSRRSQWARRSKIWSAFASYFPARLHRSVELEPTRKYIFGYHPHGIISHGAFAAFGTEALGFSELFPGITNALLTLDTNFRIPLYRDYILAMGLGSVSRESIENLLSKGGHDNAGMGRAVTIVVGGARESLDGRPHTLRLVLNARKGFIKLAIRMGADVVPVLCFGENDLYEQVDSVSHPWIHKWQMLLKKALGFTIPLFHARGIFNYDVGLMPYRTPMNIVVGRPIQVLQQGQKTGAVDQKYLDEIHAKYTDELFRIWNTHKDTFAPDREEELEIVE